MASALSSVGVWMIYETKWSDTIIRGFFCCFSSKCVFVFCHVFCLLSGKDWKWDLKNGRLDTLVKMHCTYACDIPWYQMSLCDGYFVSCEISENHVTHMSCKIITCEMCFMCTKFLCARCTCRECVFLFYLSVLFFVSDNA